MLAVRYSLGLGLASDSTGGQKENPWMWRLNGQHSFLGSGNKKMKFPCAWRLIRPMAISSFFLFLSLSVMAWRINSPILEFLLFFYISLIPRLDVDRSCGISFILWSGLANQRLLSQSLCRPEHDKG